MTDQQRNTLAIAVCGLILLGYMLYQSATRPPTTQPAPKTETETTTTTRTTATRTTAATAPSTTPDTRPSALQTRPSAPATGESPPPPPSTGPRSFEPAGVKPVDDIILGWQDPKKPEGFRLQVTLTTRGAAVTKVALADYLNVDRTGPLVLFGLDEKRKVLQRDPSLLPYVVPPAAQRLLLLNQYNDARPHKTYNLEDVNFRVVPDETDTAQRTKVTFETTVLPDQLRIRKTFELNPDSYVLDLSVEVTNLGETPRPFSYQLETASDIPHEQPRIGQGAPPPEIEATLVLKKPGGGFTVEYLKAASAPEPAANDQGAPWGNPAEGQVATAAGLINSYFAVLTMPRDEADQKRVDFVRAEKAVDLQFDAELQADKKGDNLRTQLSQEQRDEFAAKAKVNVAVHLVTRPGEVVQPGEPWTHHYRLFAGPKEPKTLKPYAQWGLPDLFSYWVGILNPIAAGLAWLLQFFHTLPPYNYGVAILLLTLVVRAAMHPLTRKQARAMAGLQTLKPQIDKLKEQFKGDKQGFGRAQMALYKEHGYNPMSGCLPMLIQMPIFIALYQALRVSPGLRQAGFIWPITDLSQPDGILAFRSISLIFIEVDHLRLLPILSMVSMFLAQKFTPKPPGGNDQQANMQKKMMVVMFVVFGVMLYNIASGLLLYITFSSFLGVLEQWHIRKGLAHLSAQGPAAAKAPVVSRPKPPASATRRARRR